MDVNSILWQLKSGIISETAVPNSYITIPEIASAIIQYKWYVGPQTMPGWTTLIKYINYSS